MLRRILACTATVVGLLAVAPVTAHASAKYCQWDPPVTVTTPAGHLVVVYADVSSPFGDVSPGVATSSTKRAYTPTGTPYTVVAVQVWVPPGVSGPFPVNDVVTSGLLGTGTLYAKTSGMSGQTLSLQFSLDTP